MKAALKVTFLPIVAIGGIHEGNTPELCFTGVHGLALVSATCSADDPKASAARLLELMG